MKPIPTQNPSPFTMSIKQINSPQPSSNQPNLTEANPRLNQSAISIITTPNPKTINHLTITITKPIASNNFTCKFHHQNFNPWLPSSPFSNHKQKTRSQIPKSPSPKHHQETQNHLTFHHGFIQSPQPPLTASLSSSPPSSIVNYKSQICNEKKNGRSKQNRKLAENESERLKDQNPAPAGDPSALAPPCLCSLLPPPPSPHRVLSSAVAALAEATCSSRDVVLITTAL
ncbi:hypothetical protein M0R45_002327 [Rubus argutus]|uniref:Uncharacterized protein n=1 Tax=Rubus argutus TaxID=59490 RepID=A0AAW1VGF4_RUBAR